MKPANQRIILIFLGILSIIIVFFAPNGYHIDIGVGPDNLLAIVWDILTGRKQKDYGKITETQLKPIKFYKDYKILYYPDKLAHTLENYLQWKVTLIKEIMGQGLHGLVKFHIYDNFEELFPRITKDISPLGRYFNCCLIQEQADWIQNLNIEL